MNRPMQGHGGMPSPITCAVCRKRVARAEVREDIERKVMVIDVWCHGEHDVCEIPHMHLPGVGDTIAITSAIAFKTERIT